MMAFKARNINVYNFWRGQPLSCDNMRTQPVSNREVIQDFFKMALGLFECWVWICVVTCRQRTPQTQALERTFSTRLRKLRNLQSDLWSLLYSKKVRDLYWWNYVMHCLRPFPVVSNRNIRDDLRYKMISLNSFTRYMSLLTWQGKYHLRNVSRLK